MKKTLVALVLSLPTIAALAAGIQSGLYVEVYTGWKWGARAGHAALKRTIEHDEFLIGFRSYCVEGYTRAARQQDSVPGFAVDREKRYPPKLTQCNEKAAAILIGPLTADEAKEIVNHFDKSSNYLGQYASPRHVPSGN